MDETLDEVGIGWDNWKAARVEIRGNRLILTSKKGEVNQTPSYEVTSFRKQTGRIVKNVVIERGNRASVVLWCKDKNHVERVYDAVKKWALS
ncbi:MAG: hypothetical protein ACR2JC_07630 [Chloroflexota bacterium]